MSEIKLAINDYGISLAERARAQELIEAVYHQLRIWPETNPGPRPELVEVMPRELIEAKVLAYLKLSERYEEYRGRPISSAELTAELARMQRQTRAPETLQSLFAALEYDPVLLRECLARPVLAGHGVFELEGLSELLPHEPIPAGGLHTAAARDALLNTPGAPDSWTDTVSAPEARYDHSAVWTGTEMIVWGGWGPVNGRLGSGGRYDPATDSWRPTSMGSEVPEGRIYHTAIWTGTEMIVWGGVGASTMVASGGRYNPATDTWVPTSQGDNVPEPRFSHSAVWTGTEMIIWGGTVNGGYSNSGGRYDPLTDIWTQTSVAEHVPAPRTSFSCVWTGSEMIIWSGMDSSGYLGDGARYSPVSDSWTPTSAGAGMPAPRVRHVAVWTGTEMIVYGGVAHSTNTGGRYSPATDTWGPEVGPGPTSLDAQEAVWTGSEMIVWGYGSGRYDPTSNQWTDLSTSLPIGFSKHTAVWTGTEMIVWGGERDVTVSTGGRYNPATDSWLPTGAIPEERQYATSVWTGAEMLIWGGSGSSTESLASGARYSPVTDSWAVISDVNAPSPREGHTAIWTGTEMIVWGGNDSYFLRRTGGRYNPATDGWSPTSTAPGVPNPRDWHTAVWTGTEMIVWGGCASGEVRAHNTGGRYNPDTNTWLPTSLEGPVPEKRYWHSAVWAGDRMIVWGGRHPTSGYTSSGSSYFPEADSWSSLGTTGGVPAARGGHSAVWTGSEMIIWGGGNYSGYFRSGSRYSPTSDTWQATSTGTGVPRGRREHTTVWTGNEMIIWGGTNLLNGSGDFLDDGARYYPAHDTWVPITTSGAPFSRMRHTAVWTGNEMIVWGGYRGGFVCLSSGARYFPPDCSAATPPVPLGDVVAEASTCHDLGVKLSWLLPQDWGDEVAAGRAVEVLRDGIPLGSGGCATLPPDATSCLDATGDNGVVYTYAARFKSSCGMQVSTIGTPATDFPPEPLISGPSIVLPGAPFTLDAGAGYLSYLWGTGQQSQTITVITYLDRTYSVAVTDSTGCVYWDEHIVRVEPNLILADDFESGELSLWEVVIGSL